MAMLLQLLMNAVPVRLRTLPRRLDRNRLVPKQLGFQFLFAPAFGQRPTDASRSRPPQIVVDRAQPHPATARDLSLPQPQLQPQPQDFLRFPHGHSPCRHSVLLIDGVSLPCDCPASLPPTAARLWKTFRSKLNTIPVDEQNCSPSQRNGVHLQTGMLFGITTEWRSASDRNRVHLRPDSPLLLSVDSLRQNPALCVVILHHHAGALFLRNLLDINLNEVGIPNKRFSCVARHEIVQSDHVVCL